MAGLILPLDNAAVIFAILMAIVLFVPILAERARIPAIVGLILAGTVVGPHVLGFIEREGFMAIVGSVGLLYLMFVAGLELDLDEFAENRADSIGFGTLTFILPMGIGIGVFLAVGFDLLAAILLASAYASHTLVTYPVFRRFGTMRNRAVSTSVGATILTDTAALIVLVIVARAYGGDLDAMFWIVLTLSLAALLVLTLAGIPRITRWFFAGLGQHGHVRFLFAMVMLFGASAAAELAGIEAIIGAFLAGLALNRQVPDGSALMERVEFLGSSFLIPIFLVSVGMLIDPAVLIQPATFGISAAFVGVALGAKFLAAGAAGGIFGYSRIEIGAMSSLSSAQAAATLAAVVVGLQVGLITTETMNAVVVTILVTCLVSSWLAARYAPRLERPAPKQLLGHRVLVPVARPESAAPLAGLAASIARRDSGVVVPLTVVLAGDAGQAMEEARAVSDDAEAAARTHGVETHAVVRVDATTAGGVLHTIIEEHASALVLGWKGHSDRRESLFGGKLDSIVARSPVPTLVARLDGRPLTRIVVAVSDSVSGQDGLASLRLAVECARRIARDTGLPLAAVSNTADQTVRTIVESRLGTTMLVDERRRSLYLRDRAEPGDLLIVPVRPEQSGLRGAATRIARAVPEHQLVFTVSHGTELPLDAPVMPSAASLQEPITGEVAVVEKAPRDGGVREHVVSVP